MKIVSPFLKKVVYPSMARSGMLQRARSGGMAVVTYHGVMPEGYEAIDPVLDGNLVTAEVLDQQLGLLKKHYDVIAPEDVRAWRRGQYKLPARAVLITCDDGLVNCVTDMLPVLRQRGVKCLFFLTGMSAADAHSMLWYEELLLWMLRGVAGGFEIACEGETIHGELSSREQRLKLWWDMVRRLSRLVVERREKILVAARAHFQTDERREREKSEPLRRRFGLMTSAEVHELAAAGMTIGAHTMSHPVLSQGTSVTARWEILESKRRLESALQEEVWAFAYPFGDASSVTPQITAMPAEAGFDAAFLNYGGGLGTDLPAYELPRVHVSAGMSPSEFDAHVSGFHARLQRMAGRDSNRLSVEAS